MYILWCNFILGLKFVFLFLGMVMGNNGINDNVKQKEKKDKIELQRNIRLCTSQ